MPYSVLIVDDSKLARMSLAKVLNGLRPDWTRLEAINAEEALASIGANDPDIALLDFNMPGRDGLQLASEIRRLKPDMPIALVSANIQDEIVVSAKAVGATFLAKPLTQQAVADFLSAAQLRLRTSTR